MLINGNALRLPLADGVVRCCVTSPPYYGLRDYETDGQIGLEETPQAYVDHLVAVFREVWRVLRDDGTAWLNLGDTYSNEGKNGGTSYGKNSRSAAGGYQDIRNAQPNYGLPAKNLLGIPWRVALALQADGWYLRSDIIWHKLNPLPEPVMDRPTKSHDYLFLLSKSARYYYDAEAIMEPCSEGTHARVSQNVAAQVGSYRAHGGKKSNGPMKACVRNSSRKIAKEGSRIRQNRSFEAALALPVEWRNKRTVWAIAARGYGGAHFATYPPALVEPCILAGSAKGDVVLDPFCGSGTTGLVARLHKRRFVGVDLNRRYLEDFALPRAERKQTAASIRTLPLFAQE